MTEGASQTLLAPETKTAETTINIAERASKSIAESKDQNKTQESFFNFKDIEKITDPAARKYAEDAYKSMQADYTRKMQEFASTRRELESLKQKPEQSSWTPERIKELLSDPTFVDSARQVTGDPSDEFLTPEEIKAREEKKAHTEQLRLLSEQVNSIKTQAEDERLKAKYADYDPETVNKFQMDLITGRYQATREDVYKVANFDRLIKQAYELGLKDRQTNLSEKRAGSTQIGSTSITSAEQVPEKQPKENTVDYFIRLASRRLQALGQK